MSDDDEVIFEKYSEYSDTSREEQISGPRPNGQGGEIKSEQPPVCPVIKIVAGELPRLVNETEAALIAANSGLYNRSGQIVRIAEIETIAAEVASNNGGKREPRTTKALTIGEQGEHTLLEDASAAACYMRFNGKDKEWHSADPPKIIIKALQGRMTRLKLPLLEGIISSPIIMEDGRLIDKPGYDPGTGLYFDPLGTVFPPIPQNPTIDDAVRALDLLCGLLTGFPFIEDEGASESVALSGLMTAVQRRALDYAFMHSITAPAFGTGKTYLADLFSMIVSGRIAPAISPSSQPEEFEKRLDSALLKGLGVLLIDNVNGLLESDKLAIILSGGAVDIRLFHTQKLVTIVPCSLAVSTGCNLSVIEDLRRRTLLCSLDAKEERPELRKFSKPGPLAVLKADRGKYVAAVLTIVRAFMQVKNRPCATDPINNYERYCAMIRDPLMWLGCADPCATMEKIREQDSRLTTKNAIAALWLAIFEDEEKTAAQVIEEASRRYHDDRLIHREFHTALAEIARDGKALSALRLGNWLGQVKGTVITLGDGNALVRYTFESGLSRTRVMRWKLAEIPKQT
jgi:hypothetical protein